MALDRFEIEFKNNPGRFSGVVWYEKEVSVQGIEKGGNQISMVGAVGQTLNEPGIKRPLRIWTQLVKNCATGAANVMLGSNVMRKSEWGAEVDIRDEEFRINIPDDEGGMMPLPIQWSFMYTDTPQGRVVRGDGREIKNTTTSFSGRAQFKMMAAEPQLETESTVRLHPRLSAVKQVMAVVPYYDFNSTTVRSWNAAHGQGGSEARRQRAPGMHVRHDRHRQAIYRGRWFIPDGARRDCNNSDQNSSEEMYLEFGDEIGEVNAIDLDEVMQVGDEGARAATDALTLEQQTAVKMYKAELTCGQHQPEITEPTEIPKLF